jgi:hypothetical protein
MSVKRSIFKLLAINITDISAVRNSELEVALSPLKSEFSYTSLYHHKIADFLIRFSVNTFLHENVTSVSHNHHFGGTGNFLLESSYPEKIKRMIFYERNPVKTKLRVDYFFMSM